MKSRRMKSHLLKSHLMKAHGLIMAGLALITGCGSSAPAPMPDAEVRDGGLSLDSCESNRDCAGGEVCRGGFCRTSCEVSSECGAPLAVCDEGLGYCVQCADDGDCGADETCSESMCEFFCRRDRDVRRAGMRASGGLRGRLPMRGVRVRAHRRPRV